MNVLADLITRHGVDVLEHLDRQVSVPVLTGLQAQGDVIVVPEKGAPSGVKFGPVPPEGVVVVQGEVGGNTHTLLGDGPVEWAPESRTGDDVLRVGVLRVPVGAVAWLAHPEHAYSGVGPGVYEVRRQRQLLDRVRRVQD